MAAREWPWPRSRDHLCEPRQALTIENEQLRAGRGLALAVDAAWTALSGGSPYVQPQEVERQLSRWRPDASTLDLDEFSTSLMQGRAVVGSGYLMLFGLQALTVALLVIQPLLELVSSG